MCPLLEDWLPVKIKTALFILYNRLHELLFIDLSHKYVTVYSTFNVKFSSKDPPIWVYVWWQTPHRAGALQEKATIVSCLVSLFFYTVLNLMLKASIRIWKTTSQNMKLAFLLIEENH